MVHARLRRVPARGRAGVSDGRRDELERGDAGGDPQHLEPELGFRLGAAHLEPESLAEELGDGREVGAR